MKNRFSPVVLALAAWACAPDQVSPSITGGPVFARFDAVEATGDALAATMEAINGYLGAEGSDYRVGFAEWVGEDEGGDAASPVVFFRNVGNRQLGHHFVSGDPRRGGRTNITYLVDQTEGAVDGLTVGQTSAAIARAMTTWNDQACAGIPITRLPDMPGVDLGVVEFTNGLGGSADFLADVTHAGWLPAGVLTDNVIGVTFTFIFVSGGVPTDIDNDGKLDTAFREILYNDRFVWRINGNIDVETVALHEAGHGLSQAHFGKAFSTTNGKLHFSPLAVMNAAYSGIQQGIGETDNAGHCSIWASWPNN